MKNLTFVAVLCALLGSLLAEVSSKAESIAVAEVKTIAFVKSGAVVLNPGQGWILYGSPRNQSPDTIALGTTGYQRFDWCVLNPQEDVYNWSPIDTAIAQWAQHGKQFCFGVMSVNTFGNVYATPKWVFDKGAKYTMGNNEANRTEMRYYIPVWNDPIYVSACKKFAEALAKRYDGNPNVAFIDVRNYGNWGENHMYPFERNTLPLKPEEVTGLLFKPYIDCFKRTPLIICHLHTVRNITFQDGARFDYDYESIKHWAVDNGMGLRRDGIMGRIGIGGSDGDEIAAAIGKTPIAWEFLGTFRNRERDTNRTWDDDVFIDIIKKNKPQYIGMGQWGNDAQYMLSRKPELIKRVANMMGFNFAMTSAQYTNMLWWSVTIDSVFVRFKRQIGAFGKSH